VGKQLVKTTYYWNNLLVGAINPALAAPLLLSAAKVGLGTAILTPSPATVYSDLVEATYVGYTESATVVWETPVNETDGSQTSFSPSHLFRATSNATPNTVTCLFVTDGVASPSTGILGSGNLEEPFDFVNPGDGFSVTVGWNEGLATPNSDFVIAT